ncbi:hypothetical protein BX661DRAFT_170532 [Kickxella alabastrina]|uniref:uncharacterized protein n=1 Tax=Kickxella alabastrina TaxID=61397 RepID=UPI002220236B|nr:uncharacterized protein BX661DRAFT_170532 [Kickxella alabastrina]KAI7829086.1 hypothetical protein BX661DRAFT_170532 [Kickxella alabastrina]
MDICTCTVVERIGSDAEYDDKLFHRVIEASPLTEDVKNLPAGNMPEIGCNGVNLSGGQKTRPALASGSTISNKTRILATHAEHLASFNNKVITLDDGCARIVEQTPAQFEATIVANTDELGTPETFESSDIGSTSDIDNSTNDKGTFTIRPENGGSSTL